MPKYLRELLLSNLLNMVITNTGNESNGNGNQNKKALVAILPLETGKHRVSKLSYNPEDNNWITVLRYLTD
jgi:hypothetical protein